MLQHTENVVPPPGPNELKSLYRNFLMSDDGSFAVVEQGGRPIVWRCDPGPR
jgi:hypothetical protein